MRYKSNSLEETRKIAEELLRDIEARHSEKTDEAMVIGLSGHLGAGKTAFVKAIANAVGVKEEVTSPTFVIMKIYSTAHSRWPRLVHIDAYRLEKPEELESLNFESVVSDPKNLIFIEWPENVSLKKPVLSEHLSFEMIDGVLSIIGD